MSIEFRSPDLYLSAFFQASGLDMIRTDREKGRIFFVFDDPRADDLKAQWFNGTATVRAQQYASAIKNLKSLCHSA